MPSRCQLSFSPEAIRGLDSMDSQVRTRLVDYLEKRVLPLEDPRMMGKVLRRRKWEGCWRYRCGDYRIIVRLLDQELIIVVLRAGNRKDVY